ncbi:transcriptional regulator [Lactobacillus jensenii]|uniref:Transcriptional regulator n=2 Tax=Lactobacillales TaxID=186826 RepID=A0ABU9FH92_LACJE|nr:transcriptional regulator [Lactobacillus jensenii]DAR66652.1 MAG TPA: transcriptional activator [Caudoviricetes sp.]MCW8072186.1 transcriptional regulator [Lactobacillus jensenii]MCW8089586.1 transcriptional regulator [Lactobacillus jensenii]MDK8236068.1 transcriptional regulator [Lactobacillus jensenii]MDT9544356.1 transcriptional regulator [Lactobacillus jensenii]
MRKQTKGYIESLLEDYPKYYDYVKQREYELRHPYIPVDENVGGGKAQFKKNDVQDRILITIEEDRRLNNLRREHYAIKTCYDEASSEVRKIVDELYFKSPRLRKYHSIYDLCDFKVIKLSRPSAYNYWNKFLQEIADELGLRY